MGDTSTSLGVSDGEDGGDYVGAHFHYYLFGYTQM
jgi:hypothetical protein